MRPGVHFDVMQTSAQSSSHTARRIMYALAALAREAICSLDVPSAYSRASADQAYWVTMRQPRRAEGFFKNLEKLVLQIKSRMDSLDGGYLWERFRIQCLPTWGRELYLADLAWLLYEDSATEVFTMVLADTDDFITTSAALKLLERLLSKLHHEWDVAKQAPLEQPISVAVSLTAYYIQLPIAKHIEKHPADFSLQNWNPTKTSHNPRADLS